MEVKFLCIFFSIILKCHQNNVVLLQSNAKIWTYLTHQKYVPHTNPDVIRLL